MKYHVYWSEWDKDIYENVSAVEIDYGTLRLYQWGENNQIQLLASYSVGNWRKIQKEAG